MGSKAQPGPSPALPNGPQGADSSRNSRLDSWKEIADFFRKDVRTVQRWEKSNRLPVHRYPDKSGSVYAYTSELDAWMRSAEGSKAEQVTAEESREVREDKGYDEYEETTYDNLDLQPRRRRRWLLWVAVAGVLMVLAVVTGRRLYDLVWPRQHKIKLMVRTLQSVGPGGPQDAFSQGMTDELITRLGRSSPEKLGVLARTTADTYSRKPIPELKSLGLDYVLEGSVFQDQNRVRINTQLIDTEDGTQVSARSYEGETKDVLELQAAAADDIVLSLKLPLKPKGREQPKEVNPQAYGAYMRGQYTWNQRGQNSVANSMTYFKEAIALDPNYAPAYAGLADAYALLASAQYGIIRPVEGFDAAKQYAERAIQLDPDLAAPHASLGYIYLVFDRNPEAARRQFEKALELDPNYLTAHQWFGLYYEVIGKMDEAFKQIRLAYEREPASIPVNLALAEAYYFDRQYDKAIEQALSTVQLEPTSALGHFNMGRAYEMKGMHEQALEQFKTARENAPNIATLGPLAYEYARAGDLATSTEYLKQLFSLAEQQGKFVPAIYFTMAYAGRNDKPNALKWLERANRERCDYIVFLARDPMVDPLRGDPRFEAIARQQ
jgi:TolB-like protein/Tfp pilus assembly protein PilF